jgi:hypothetical protein
MQLMDTVSSVHLDHPSFVCKVDPLYVDSPLLIDDLGLDSNVGVTALLNPLVSLKGRSYCTLLAHSSHFAQFEM